MDPRFTLSERKLDLLLHEKFTNKFRTGYITLDGICLPEYFLEFVDKIENFQVRDDDIWICSFPKAGTTWTQEMVWCLANDLDFEKGKIMLPERFPFLERSTLFDFREIIQTNPDEDKPPESFLDSVSFVNKMKSPRFIKTHLPFHLLPKQIRTMEKRPKIINITRNVKDTCISYFHHSQIFEGFSGTFEEFCDLFLGGKVCFGPFWTHILGFWEHRNQPNMLFLKFENMKFDIKSVIKETAQFLEINPLTESELKIFENHLSFESMKSNPAVNYEKSVKRNKQFKLIDKEGKFMRSGKVNQWQEAMSIELIDRFDSWSKECLKNKNFTFQSCIE